MSRTLLFAWYPGYGPTYGPTWICTDPNPRRLRVALVLHWSQGNATELVREVPGRRDVRI